MPEWRHPPNPEQRAVADAVGRLVLRARLELGVTQRQVAERVDVSTSTICRIERGQVAVSVFTLYRVAEVLGGLTIGIEPATGRRPLRRPTQAPNVGAEWP
jgi:transcriptional regulator with XRE-family HTH domain